MLRLPASVLASSLALVTLLAAAAGCGADAPSAAQCGKLLDHLVELEIGAAGGGKGLTPEMQADLGKQKAAVLEAKGPEFTKKCSKEMPGPTVHCMLAAKSIDEAGKCGESK
ncbi:MAG: hypothetical protein KBG28_02090 [Kofleriaceae bacterium]|jgi:hypothetical protein|nr:hypothetical protein [Kofleriaceae bacterium]MBP6840552.1 hypothetical protein [Kofleriaceae bacterium]MBP9202746.1 hypothetical protein [Kofleriaceae bacterium]